jgi:hypothetical protein
MNLELTRAFLDLNQAFDQVLRGLERMEEIPFFQTSSLRYARAEVETARVEANREFFDRFAEIVENDARWAYKFRRQHDRKTTDPFDFYLELKEREDTRRKKGLPPRAILLPRWDQDDDARAATRKPANRSRQSKGSARKAEKKRDQ